MTSYLEMLQTLGFPAVERGVWASVGVPNRAQGWMLQLSSVKAQAGALIARVGPLLRERAVPFRIAWNDEMLGELNEGTFGASEVGKFATVYPRSNGEAVSLAGELVALTQGFSGPRIVTDRPLGNNVYTCFGSFYPRCHRDPLAPEEVDYGVSAPAPEIIVDPFEDWPEAGDPHAGSRRLVGPGFMLTRALSVGAKGAVFLALDLQSPDRLDLAVVKEGRRMCMPDAKGRHMWHRLRHQRDLGEALADRVRTPRPRALFEQRDSLFLALDHVDGRDLAERPRRPFGALDQNARQAMIADLAAIAETLAALHGAGVVHRDLSPHNVRIDQHGKAWLVDLEMAHLAGERDGLFMPGTAGPISPEQDRGEAASFGDDLYAFGCLVAFLLTGLEARQMPLDDDQALGERLAVLSGGAHALVDLCAGLLRADPASRTSLAEVRSALAVMAAGRVAPALAGATAGRISGELLHQAAAWLTHGGRRDAMTGLPLSCELPPLDQDSGLSPQPACKLLRGASRGVAGVLYAVARLARIGVRAPDAAAFAHRAAEWLLSHQPAADGHVPGLHVGEAGVALALLEAIRSGLVDNGRWLRPYLAQTFGRVIDWPDLASGAAGQGLAALQAAYLAGMPELALFADRCADHLVATQHVDGSWRSPGGGDALENIPCTGLAHGTAGVAYFLTIHAGLRASTASRAAALRAGSWLVDQARPSGEAPYHWWPAQADGDGAWHWWCDGGPGIVLALLALYELTGDPLWAGVSRSALRVHPVDVRHGNLGQRHGLAGLGEVQLEAWRTLGEIEWLERARTIGSTLAALPRTRDGMASWRIDDGIGMTADLMVGSGGVAHFLARLHAGERCRLGMPLSIDSDLMASCAATVRRAGALP